MTDWLEPLWNLFTPKGALQQQLDDGNPSTPTYSAFGRYAKTFKYKVMNPVTSEPATITFFKNYANPISNANEQKIIVVKDETANADPRVDSTNANEPNYDATLSNMDIQTTSNSSTSSVLAIVGIFFIALLVLSRIFKK